MAFNGSGTFVRLYNWVTDKANGIFVRADRMDNEMDGFATGLTNCVTRDGQSPALADLSMGGFKLMGLANGVATTDAATVGQLSGAGTYFDIGNSGTGVTVDFDTNGPDQQVTLTNNATLTLANGGASPISATLKIIQDGTGGRTITWAGTDYSASRWLNAAAAPVLSRVLSTIEFVDFYWDGTIWFQQHRGAVARSLPYIVTATRITSDQTFTANGGNNDLVLNSASDPYSEFNTTTGIFTAKVAGLYMISASIGIKNSTDGTLQIAVSAGASTMYSGVGSAGAGVNNFLNCVLVVGMVAADTAYVRGAGTGGGTVTILSGGFTFLTITRLGDKP